ncbi:MAG: MBL fold metallo-hydrolase, partial [Clostridiales bacterium]|nr:MBL fold metallo-hydrolase [Clostridiales bacterium]
MKLEFHGAAHEVTGSCHYLEFAGRHVLVDCGMEQGADIYENQELPVDATQIDYVFVTHAHIDHSGLLPLLYSGGFRGQIYATNATTKLCEIMLKDSAHIQESEAEWKNRKAKRAGSPEVEPMYTVEDAERVMRCFVPCYYDREVDVTEGLKVIFRDAGHLLGSSFIEMWITEDGTTKKLIFSGDLGNGNRALIRDPEIPTDADYLIIESTYGNRLHDVPPDYAVALARVLKETFDKGGNVVIPAFSVGRTQEMLYYLRRIKEEDMLPEYRNFEAYVDSPLSVEATGIFNESVGECFREEDLELIKSGVNPIQFEGLVKSVTADDSKAINFDKKSKVIISASGMCEAGRIRHHLKHNLWRPECCVVFVGYQVPGTMGYNLLNGATNVKLFGETIQVKAKIINLPGISGHADRDHLTAWVQGMEKMPERIFVVHGEDKVTDEFAAHLTEACGAVTTAPYSGDAWDLAKNVCIAQGDRKPAAKKKAAKHAASSAFDRLVAAGQRLVNIINKYREGANKDLAKFADQINKL